MSYVSCTNTKRHEFYHFVSAAIRRAAFIGYPQAVRELKVRLIAALMRAKREGLHRTSFKIFEKLSLLLVGALLSPVSLLGHALGFRCITFITQRVGHLAVEPDSFLKAVALGELPEKKWFFLAPPRGVANEHLCSYWSRSIPAVSNPWACHLLKALSVFGMMRFDAGRFVLWLNRSQEAYWLNAAWSDRPPLLALDQGDRVWSDTMTQSIGLPEGAWFACVHVREAGFSPGDEDTHSHRNGSIAAVLPALEEIVRRGGWCVRMGDPTSTRLPPMARVIDYAHHRLRQPRLDVCLCARSRFFLGNTSGIALVSSIFGVPSALANMVPMSCLGMLPSDISIPKLHRRTSDGKVLRFEDILGTPIASFRYAYQYRRDGIDLVENTAEDILELVREMLDRLDRRYAPSDNDERLQADFKSHMRSGDYGYRAASRVGASFLRRYVHLLR